MDRFRVDPSNNGILTPTARRSIRKISRFNAPYQSHQCLAEATSTSFSTDFATCPMESIEEENIEPLHSSTPQPSLPTINYSLEGPSFSMEGSSSSSLDSTMQTLETAEAAADPAMQENMIHAPGQLFSQLISQNHRLAQRKFSLKWKEDYNRSKKY